MKEYLEYTEDALINRVLLLSFTNEVNIIVEDTGKEFEYQKIFQRIFKDKYKISNIFPMNGKEGVKNALDFYGKIHQGNNNFYIVDGDFDLILDKERINEEYFIYLDRYNIESYFIDKEATILYMSNKLKKMQQEVEKEIEYDNWYMDTYSKLEKLFLAYVVGQAELPDEKNVGISQYTYLDKNGLFDVDKINQYEMKLKKSILNYDALMEFYYKRYKLLLNGDYERLICGKYILSSLVNYLRKKTGKNFREDDFRFFLITQFDIKKLSFIREKIDNIMDEYCL